MVFASKIYIAYITPSKKNYGTKYLNISESLPFTRNFIRLLYLYSTSNYNEYAKQNTVYGENLMNA